MAQLKSQLEAAGFDTAGLDEQDLVSKLDQAGFDTSSLSGGETPTGGLPQAESEAPKESKAKRFIRGVAKSLPIAGSIGVPAAAALSTGGLSLPATAGLAGVGGAGGEAFKQLILRSIGDSEGVPATSGEAAKKIGVTGAADAALTYAGGKAFQGAGKLIGGAKKLITGPSVEEAKALASRATETFIPQAEQKATELGRRSIQAGEENIGKIKESLTDFRSKVVPAIGEAETKASQYGKQILDPLKEKITQIRAGLKATGEKGASKLKQLDVLEQEVKKEFGQIENAGGAEFKSTPKFERMVASRTRVAQLASKLDKLTPDVAKQLPTGKLQVYRKLGQEASDNISEIGNAQIQKGREVAAKELENRIPGFKDVRSRFHSIKSAQEDVVQSTKKAQVAFKTKLKDSIDTFRQQEKEVADMVRTVRSSERQALNTQQKGDIASAQKSLIGAQAELKRIRLEAQDLIRQAKDADSTELKQIAGEGDKLIQSAMTRSKVIKGLKVAGLAALGIKGASYLP